MKMDIETIFNILTQQSLEIENLLRRRIFDLQVQLITANERIAELEKKSDIVEF
jgi:hypothetical protein